MRVLFLIAMLGGCNKLFDLERVTIDGTGDSGTGDSGNDGNLPDSPPALCPISPVVFDEDGDSIDDRCDACPTVPSDTGDVDFDGLPNACDPNLNAGGGDRILFVATFFEENHLSAFTATGQAIWSANNKGTVSLAGSRLRTNLSYAPTLIDVRVSGMTASQASANFAIGNASLRCTLYGSNCAGTATNEVCMRFGTGQADAGALVSSLSRMAITVNPATTVCTAYTSTAQTLTSTTPFGDAQVDIEVNPEAQVVVQSIVVYGAK